MTNLNEYRIIVNDVAAKEQIFDAIVSGKNLPEPTKWNELPEALGVGRRKIVAVTREELLKNVFRIDV